MNRDDLAALVRSVRPSDADRVDDLFTRTRRDELFNEIVRTPNGAQTVGSRRVRPGWGARLRAPSVGRSRPGRRLAMLSAVAALASVAAIVITIRQYTRRTRRLPSCSAAVPAVTSWPPWSTRSLHKPNSMPNSPPEGST